LRGDAQNMDIITNAIKTHHKFINRNKKSSNSAKGRFRKAIKARNIVIFQSLQS